MDVRPLRYWHLLLAASVLSWSLASAGNPHSREGRTAIRGVIERWLAAEGLAQDLELQKLRWGPHADNPDAKWLKLELRFVSQGTNQDQENRRFQQLLERYRGIAGTSLPDRLFYKFLHASGVQRRDAYVAIGVLTRTFESRYDPTAGQLAFRETDDRLIRRSTLLRMPVQTAQVLRKPVGLGFGREDPDDLPRRIQHALQRFFLQHNQQAGLPPPQLTLKPLERWYAGIEVQGTRKLVLTDKNYWERLQVSIELHAEGDEVRAVCYLDGMYAAGLGSRLPAEDGYADMDPAYRPELERFVDALLHDLQADFAAGAQ
ncbi:MAG: hypothetical protein QNJ91_11655 [Gammaproteobacteria bacterium]|nr:hypothetical protein [Gammaproteobacteria bacterium]